MLFFLSFCQQVQSAIRSSTSSHVIPILISYDDVGGANPIGSRAKQQELSSFSWSFAAIDDLCQTADDNVFLLAIAKCEDLGAKTDKTKGEPL